MLLTDPKPGQKYSHKEKKHNKHNPIRHSTKHPKLIDNKIPDRVGTTRITKIRKASTNKTPKRKPLTKLTKEK
jgi:hypothetical protein